MARLEELFTPPGGLSAPGVRDGAQNQADLTAAADAVAQAEVEFQEAKSDLDSFLTSKPHLVFPPPR